MERIFNNLPASQKEKVLGVSNAGRPAPDRQTKTKSSPPAKRIKLSEDAFPRRNQGSPASPPRLSPQDIAIRQRQGPAQSSRKSRHPMFDNAIFVGTDVDFSKPRPLRSTDPAEHLKREMGFIDQITSRVKTNHARIALQEVEHIKQEYATRLESDENARGWNEELPYEKFPRQNAPLTAKEAQDFLAAINGTDADDSANGHVCSAVPRDFRPISLEDPEPDFSQISPQEQAQWQMEELVFLTAQHIDAYHTHAEKQKDKLNDEYRKLRDAQQQKQKEMSDKQRNGRPNQTNNNSRSSQNGRQKRRAHRKKRKGYYQQKGSPRKTSGVDFNQNQADHEDRTTKVAFKVPSMAPSGKGNTGVNPKEPASTDGRVYQGLTTDWKEFRRG